MSIVFPAPAHALHANHGDLKRYLDDSLTVSTIKLLWEAELAKLLAAALTAGR